MKFAIDHYPLPIEHQIKEIKMPAFVPEDIAESIKTEILFEMKGQDPEIYAGTIGQQLTSREVGFLGSTIKEFSKIFLQNLDNYMLDEENSL